MLLVAAATRSGTPITRFITGHLDDPAADAEQRGVDAGERPSRPCRAGSRCTAVAGARDAAAANESSGRRGRGGGVADGRRPASGPPDLVVGRAGVDLGRGDAGGRGGSLRRAIETATQIEQRGEQAREHLLVDHERDQAADERARSP